MGAVESSIKAEIVRLAKREARKLIAPVKEELRRLKKRDAERKANIGRLEQRIQGFQAKELLSATTSKASAGGVKGRLSPRLVKSLRSKLGLAQGAFAKLLGVSIGSIVNWESGKSAPRPEMRAKMLSFRGVGKREVKMMLANMPTTSNRNVPRGNSGRARKRSVRPTKKSR